jgi:hypothetical protein
MINTPYGETTKVSELHRWTQFGVFGDPVETGDWPVLIRVIRRPAIIKTDPQDGTIEVLVEAETETFCLEIEDIEIADNAIWLIVGDEPQEEEGDE